jgi:hypothetical protein
MLLMDIVFVPEMRSPVARQVRVTVCDEPVLVLEVTERGFTLVGLEGTVSGFASGKFIVYNPNVSFALDAMFVDRVIVWV